MNKKMECIQKLINEGMFLDFKEYVLDNRLVDKSHFEIYTTSNIINKAKVIYDILEQAHEDEKLLLLDYEWQYLPHEYIKLTCVSEQTGKKEFTYGY